MTGGLEVALNCDFRIASTNARFADTHSRVGVTPGSGHTWHEVEPQPMKSPSGGSCLRRSAACAAICDTLRLSGWSRQ